MNARRIKKFKRSKEERERETDVMMSDGDGGSVRRLRRFIFHCLVLDFS